MSVVDRQFEEEVAHNPYRVGVWWAYAHSKADQSAVLRFAVYERALSFLPRSYKLWRAYLSDRTQHVSSKIITSKFYDLLIETYERALVHLHKMPRIWIEYCTLMISLRKGTKTRIVFDRALQSLPVTQHNLIWNLYVSWAKEFALPETAIRVFRRYLMFDPAHREEFIDYLESIGQYGEAARQLTICLNDDRFVSLAGKTTHQLWMHLCEMCCSHSEEVVDAVKVEDIIRSGISKFSDEVGKLWNCLADFYIGLGQFEKARNIFEEAINAVITVRDFTIVFDAYVKVEESVLTTKMRFLQEAQENNAERTDVEFEEDEREINMRLARIEYLMEKRPLMLNSVMLRQNPHNVHHWQKRAKLFEQDEARQLLTFEEAVSTINPQKAVGKLSTVYLVWASVLEKKRELSQAEAVFDQAVKVNFKSVDELAAVWCGWGEMEMRHERFSEALQLLQRAVEEPVMNDKRRRAMAAAQGHSRAAEDIEGSVVSDRVFRHSKLWALYLDLEESLGTVASCRAAYDRAMDLKVITAQMALNYAAFLEENDFFEDSFRIYERAVSMFEFPQVKKIWVTYIDKFIARYEGSKLERLRDLFEQVISKCPIEDAAEFYIKYAKAEEEFGMARHVVTIYDRAVLAVPEASRLNFFLLYAKKVEQLFGITRTRPVYEKALKELNDSMCKDICRHYANMERKLGEIDRARAIWQYGSQFADSRRDPNYWSAWREFEEAHGNEDTFREMLRVQRSVDMAFAHVNYLAQDLLDAQTQAHSAPPAAAAPHLATGMDLLAHQAEQSVIDRSGLKRKFVAAEVSTSSTTNNSSESPGTEEPLVKAARNEEEIDI